MKEDFLLRLNSILRRAGLSKVPKPVLICVAAILLVLIVITVCRFWPASSATSSSDFVVSKQEETQQVASNNGEIAVDVEGCVYNPGLYHLSSDKRVGDAIEAAGGRTTEAAATGVNLAQKLSDGMQIFVPREDEIQASGQGTAANGSTASSVSSGSLTSGSSSDGKININTASSEQLQTLSGIGEAIAQRIIDYREKTGKFSKIEDLKNVSGIGDAKFNQVKDKICV